MSIQGTTVLSSALRSGTTDSGTFSIPDWTPADPGFVTIYANVTAATALTALTFEVQWSLDGGANFHSVDGTKDITTNTITGATKVCRQFPVRGSSYRVQAIVTGTNATFDVKAAYQA